LVLNLISLASICSFIFWARRRTEAGVRDREDLSQKTVLIVGNNPRLYERAVAATESAGFSVAVVRGAESVLDRLAQGGIDVVIITETMLPDAYGDALVKAVRHGYSEVPIFTFSDPLASPNHEALFSGHKDFRETPHEEGLSLEVFLSRKGYIPDLFLSPPVKPKELVAFVRGVLK
jgi:CheY-like chemotaxis protein